MISPAVDVDTCASLRKLRMLFLFLVVKVESDPESRVPLP